MFFLTAWTSCTAQINQIEYLLPETVVVKIEDYVSNQVENKNLIYSAYLFKNDDGKFVLSIIDYNTETSSDGFQLVFDNVVKRSNRVIKVNKDIIPVFAPEDIEFSDFGSIELANGRVARQRVLMAFDGYIITFDRSGKIYEN